MVTFPNSDTYICMVYLYEEHTCLKEIGLRFQILLTTPHTIVKVFDNLCMNLFKNKILIVTNNFSSNVQDK